MTQKKHSEILRLRIKRLVLVIRRVGGSRRSFRDEECPAGKDTHRVRMNLGRMATGMNNARYQSLSHGWTGRGPISSSEVWDGFRGHHFSEHDG